MLYDHELHGCLNCGICTATCPSAHYYDYSPREIVQLLWTENLEGIYDAMQGKDLGLRPVLHLRGALPVREFARRPRHDHARGCDQARHAKSAKDVLRPFSRVLLEGGFDRQPACPQHDHQARRFPTGGRTSPRSRRRSTFCARRFPCRPCTRMDTAWEVNLKHLGRALHDLGSDRRARSARDRRRESLRPRHRRDGRRSGKNGTAIGSKSRKTRTTIERFQEKWRPVFRFESATNQTAPRLTPSGIDIRT